MLDVNSKTLVAKLYHIFKTTLYHFVFHFSLHAYFFPNELPGLCHYILEGKIKNHEMKIEIK